MRTKYVFAVAAVALAISTAALGVDTTIPAKVEKYVKLQSPDSGFVRPIPRDCRPSGTRAFRRAP